MLQFIPPFKDLFTPMCHLLCHLSNVSSISCVTVARQFFLPFKDSFTGHYVKDRNAIAAKYLKGWFFIDFLSILPFDIISAVFNIPSTLRIVR